MSNENDKTIFILLRDITSIGSAEQYLSQRGWTVQSSTNLRVGLGALVKMQPRYFLLSVDFPHPQVETLPQLLAQASSALVIPFGEEDTPQAYRLIQAMKKKYALLPPVSGTSIERLLLKIEKDEEQTIKDLKNQAHQQGRATPDTKPVPEEEPPEREASSTPKRSGLAYMPSHDQTKGHEDSFDRSAPSPPKPKIVDSDPPVMKSRDLPLVPTPDKRAPASPVIESSRTKKEQPPLMFEKGAKPLKHSIVPTPEENSKASKLEPKTSAPPVESPTKDQPSNGTASSATSRELGDSLLIQATEVAMADAASPSPKHVAAIGIHKCTHLMCLPIHTPNYSGYLLLAQGSNHWLDAPFTQAFRRQIYSFMAKNGSPLADEKLLSLKVKSVPFLDWCRDSAVFIRKSVYIGQEVAVAFFMHPKTEFKIIQSAHREMLALGVQDLDADEPLEFNAYLHLPRNDKFLLYVKKQSRLMKEQKDRLMKGGMQFFHVKKADAESIHRFKLQIDLNEMIEDYLQRTAKKGPPKP